MHFSLLLQYLNLIYQCTSPCYFSTTTLNTYNYLYLSELNNNEGEHVYRRRKKRDVSSNPVIDHEINNKRTNHKSVNGISANQHISDVESQARSVYHENNGQQHKRRVTPYKTQTAAQAQESTRHRRHVPPEILRYYLMLVHHMKENSLTVSNVTADDGSIAQKFINSVSLLQPIEEEKRKERNEIEPHAEDEPHGSKHTHTHRLHAEDAPNPSKHTHRYDIKHTQQRHDALYDGRKYKRTTDADEQYLVDSDEKNEKLEETSEDAYPITAATITDAESAEVDHSPDSGYNEKKSEITGTNKYTNTTKGVQPTEKVTSQKPDVNVSNTPHNSSAVTNTTQRTATHQSSKNGSKDELKQHVVETHEIRHSTNRATSRPELGLNELTESRLKISWPDLGLNETNEAIDESTQKRRQSVSK